MRVDPFSTAAQIANIFDSLDIKYALGGSLASSIIGEPRATMDADFATRLDKTRLNEFLEHLTEDYYVSRESAEEAIDNSDSFNLINTKTSFKVDIFVLGDGLLDVNQIERRIKVQVPSENITEIWATSPEDQILRKLYWFNLSGGVSDRQWRDVLSILRVQLENLDIEYLETTAKATGLDQILEKALSRD